MDRTVLRDSREVVLGNLELIEKHGLKRAACLLFSDRPEQFVSGAWIKIGFFVTDDDLRYQDEVHGNLFEQVEKTLDLLHTKYLKAYISYQGLLRRETFLFPDAALREALLNAVVHKDYSSGIPIQISVYDDRIVLWNAGDLPDRWTLAKLLGKHPSCPFNPLVANAFFRAGYIESWGRGIEKIQRDCREHDIEPPLYDFGMAGLMLTFRANPTQVQVTGEVTEEVTGEVTDRTPVETPVENEETPVETPVKTPDRIIELLRANPHMTLTEVAEVIGRSLRAVERSTTKLVGEGWLRYVGPRKGGHWTVAPQVAPQVTPQVTPQVERLLVALQGEMDRESLLAALLLKARKSFRERYLQPALETGLIGMTIPDKPNSRLQRYRLTPAGEAYLAARRQEGDLP